MSVRSSYSMYQIDNATYSFNHTTAIVISRISYVPNLMKLVICVGLERFAKPKNRFRANYYLQSQKIQSVLFWSHTTILRIEFIPFTGYCSLPFSYNTIRLSRYQRTFSTCIRKINFFSVHMFSTFDKKMESAFKQ